ncbi:hypothetical protein D3C87_200820 [compost metagenome]
MAISKKGKRKIIVDGKTYFWWVYDEVDQTSFDGEQIKLVAEDQSHFLLYGLQQQDGNRMVVICPGKDGAGIAMECPKFENEYGIITPAGIRKLIDWCKAEPGETNIRRIYENGELKSYLMLQSQTHLLRVRITELMN